ncbi:MAG: GNAT family N-acetyltransferase [Gammaproteobacteria bacterium]|nr:GNAT family N-acetyltransferase [Gammaproteobacteria bacterium]
MVIRTASASDCGAMWEIFKAVVAPGDTYVFGADTTRADADAYWFGPGTRCCVATRSGRVLGMYKLVANQRDLGSHVANASFMVDPRTQGEGVGEALGRHALIAARAAGFDAMQFNFVVSTNHGAVRLWQRLGFNIVGTLPRAFRHARLGYVDAYVMHQFLDD